MESAPQARHHQTRPNGPGGVTSREYVRVRGAVGPKEKNVDVDRRLNAPGASPPAGEPSASTAAIELFWIPLGAGGSGLVRWNGRVYESIRARLDGRRPLDLYHTALKVRVFEELFVIETMWPSPDADTASRGVVVEGPVGGRSLARLRLFRYEVRRWRDGILPDDAEAIGGPQLLSDDSHQAGRILDSVASVPALVWGRDHLDIGDMWNSNSVISWLLTRCGLPMDEIRPPAEGRAPGWEAGIVTAGGSLSNRETRPR